MKLKEKLLKIKENLTKYTPVTRDYEFNATLKDHQVKIYNIYRLHYINYHRIGENFSSSSDNIGLIDIPFEPIMFPKGMSYEEGFKVLSYLTDFIEKRSDIEPCSLKSVSTLENALNLERLGFERINERDERNITDLFTIDGRVQLFKESELYSRYFNWYKEGITLEEVKEIYSKHNMEFSDIKWLDDENKNHLKMLLEKK